MESNISHFNDQYEVYNQHKDKILYTHQPSVQTIRDEFENLDVKLRLAFGIDEIRLNNRFVSDKEGDLKACHKMYYKLADLWFAYETYIKYYKEIIGQEKHSITWLNANTHLAYSSQPDVLNILSISVSSLTNDFQQKNQQLIEYLKYCVLKATGAQKNRLNQIATNLENDIFPTTHTDFLTISYAVRCNFVHNGETTIVPDNFGFRNKKKLLIILYSYLCIILLASINITSNHISFIQ